MRTRFNDSLSRWMLVWCSGVVLLLLFFSSAFAKNPLESDKGVIRDKKCALAVGVAILKSVYGDKAVASGAPFRAELVNGEWQISEDSPPAESGEVMLGGGYYITLSQKDGRVLLIGFEE